MTATAAAAATTPATTTTTSATAGTTTVAATTATRTTATTSATAGTKTTAAAATTTATVGTMTTTAAAAAGPCPRRSPRRPRRSGTGRRAARGSPSSATTPPTASRRGSGRATRVVSMRPTAMGPSGPGLPWTRLRPRRRGLGGSAGGLRMLTPMGRMVMRGARRVRTSHLMIRRRGS
uniref:Uncharacterized protein n=1 Tax=Arundo donax TaxID=35708 RepID=A0A0A9CZ49_ARUDO